jgi:hypothetical protein
MVTISVHDVNKVLGLPDTTRREQPKQTARLSPEVVDTVAGTFFRFDMSI